MRLVYLDEAGTSAHEPFLVVCGVMVDADRQMSALEERLEQLVAEHISEPDRHAFVFHATDIWSGNGYFRDRDEWPSEKRHAILSALVEIPAKFDLPVSVGCVDKAKFNAGATGRGYSFGVLTNTAHAVAFIECAQGVEMAMQESSLGEIALLVAENCDGARIALKQALAMCRDTVAAREAKVDELAYIPLRKIKDTVHFATKEESRLLQLADICAFFCRGYFSGHPKAPPFYDILKPQLLIHIHKPV